MFVLLQGVALPQSLRASGDMQEVVKAAEVILVVSCWSGDKIIEYTNHVRGTSCTMAKLLCRTAVQQRPSQPQSCPCNVAT